MVALLDTNSIIISNQKKEVCKLKRTFLVLANSVLDTYEFFRRHTQAWLVIIIEIEAEAQQP